MSNYDKDALLNMSKKEFKKTIIEMGKFYKKFLEQSQCTLETNVTKEQKEEIKTIADKLDMAKYISITVGNCKNCIIDARILILLRLRSRICFALKDREKDFVADEFMHLLAYDCKIPKRLYEIKKASRKVTMNSVSYYIMSPILTDDYKDMLIRKGIDTNDFYESTPDIIKEVWRIAIRKKDEEREAMEMRMAGRDDEKSKATKKVICRNYKITKRNVQ